MMQPPPADLKSFRRITVKIGSALLVDRTTGLKREWLASLVQDIFSLVLGGAEVLVVSSGAIALGRTILDTIRRAQVDAARKIEESVRPLLGDGESMRYLRDQVEQGIAVIDPGAPPAEPPTAKRPASRDDDFEGGTFLR